MSSPEKYDVFISHASEDKDSIVRAVAQALTKLGVKVWYDEFALSVGDSLRGSIDRGLANSTHGIVVLSPDFFRKKWPERELAGLVAKQVAGRGEILPIWHGVDRDDVLNVSPPLADTVAIKTVGSSAEEIALNLLLKVRPDIYHAHPHAELQKMLSGEALAELKSELERAKEELSEYRCPVCKSSMSSVQEVPVDMEEKHSTDLKVFECGHTLLGGYTQRPCPSDPAFPTLDQYEIKCRENTSESMTFARWTCDALPKTPMARAVSLNTGYGPTEAAARAMLEENYNQLSQPWDRPKGVGPLDI